MDGDARQGARRPVLCNRFLLEGQERFLNLSAYIGRIKRSSSEYIASLTAVATRRRHSRRGRCQTQRRAVLVVCCNRPRFSGNLIATVFDRGGTIQQLGFCAIWTRKTISQTQCFRSMATAI
jgi:hypothetical protein